MVIDKQAEIEGRAAELVNRFREAEARRLEIQGQFRALSLEYAAAIDAEADIGEEMAVAQRELAAHVGGHLAVALRRVARDSDRGIRVLRRQRRKIAGAFDGGAR